MIDACAHVRRFAPKPTTLRQTSPLLRWTEEWYSSAGQGVLAGLLDTGFDVRIPDLVGADLTVRDFTASPRHDAYLAEHGSHSVAMLIGQGRHQIRGLAPFAHLLVARVVGPDGVAAPQTVIKAIDWLTAAGARIIVLPLGEPVEREELNLVINRATDHGVIVFAAAGNGHPEPLMFPARHPSAIAVGAANAAGDLLPECSRWPRLDLIAPGCRIPAPIRGRIVRRRSGSSVACVIAAGVAMLALSAGAIADRSMSRASILDTLRRGWLAQHSS